MKNKKLVYILLPLALIVWGLVIYRIITFTNQDEDLSFQNSFQQVKLVDSTLVDTFTITANYKDPFKRTLAVSSNKKNEKQNQKVNKRGTQRNRSVRRIRWPDIQYGGIIENNQQNEIIAIIKIDEKSYLLKKGDENQDVKVLEIYNDSIRLEYKEEKKTIIKAKE